METVIVEKPGDHIAIVTLNRERKVNAMSLQMFTYLILAIVTLVNLMALDLIFTLCGRRPAKILAKIA